MQETFQKEFLGIRKRLLDNAEVSTDVLAGRYWLERVLREMTFICAAEQNASIMRTFQAKVLRSHEFDSLRTTLEEHLYYKLRTEWKLDTSFSQALEHLLWAKLFGRLDLLRVKRLY